MRKMKFKSPYPPKVFVVTLVALVIFITVDISLHKKPPVPIADHITTSHSIDDVQKRDASHCGLTVNSPLPGTIVTFPLHIQANVDNTQSATLGCSWSVFEAQAGNISIKSTSGQILGRGVLKTTGNWMTTAPTQYTATITSISQPAYTGPMQLTFTEEDTQGSGNPDMLSFIVVK